MPHPIFGHAAYLKPCDSESGPAGAHVHWCWEPCQETNLSKCEWGKVLEELEVGEGASGSTVG